MTSPSKKKPPLVAILAVLVPLLALGIGALLSTTRSSDGESASTTLAQDGDPEAAARAEAEAEGGGAEGGGEDEAEADDEDDRSDDQGSGATAGATSGEVASSPQTAGSEGDRPVVTWPQPTVPEDGCTRAGSGTAVIVLRSTPSPACVRVGADQPVEIQNRTGGEISFMGDNLNEIIGAGRDFTVGRAADAFPEGRSTFWVQGAPKLSGLIEVG